MKRDINELREVLYEKYEIEISNQELQQIVDYMADFIAVLIRPDNEEGV